MDETDFNDLPLSIILKTEPDTWESESAEQADFTFAERGDVEIKEEPLTLFVTDAFPRTLLSISSQSPSTCTDQNSLSTMDHRKGKLYEVADDDVDADFKSLLNKFQRAADKEKKFVCVFCNFETSSKFVLVRHKIAVHGEQKYACEHCNFTSGYLSDLAKHHKQCCPSLSCKQCGYSTDTQSRMREHELIHSDKYVHCDQCNFKTRRERALSKHKLAKHAVDHESRKCHLCEWCSSKFVTRVGLRNHVRSKHPSNAMNEDSKEIGPSSAMDRAIDAIYRELLG